MAVCSFSDIVNRAKLHVRQTKESKDSRDLALFELGCFISNLEFGARVVLCDGWSSVAPRDSSPAAICNMIFQNEGSKEPPNTLGHILGLDGDKNISKYFIAGARKWARQQVQALGWDESPPQEAAKAATVLAKKSWPADGLVGAQAISNKSFAGERQCLPSYHWPQKAWLELRDFYEERWERLHAAPLRGLLHTTSNAMNSRHEACGSQAASPVSSFGSGLQSCCNTGVPTQGLAPQAAISMGMPSTSGVLAGVVENPVQVPTQGAALITVAAPATLIAMVEVDAVAEGSHSAPAAMLETAAVAEGLQEAAAVAEVDAAIVESRSKVAAPAAATAVAEVAADVVGSTTMVAEAEATAGTLAESPVAYNAAGPITTRCSNRAKRTISSREERALQGAMLRYRHHVSKRHKKVMGPPLRPLPPSMEVDASDFICKLEEARSWLLTSGIAVIKDDCLRRRALRAAAAAVQLVSDPGISRPIFEYVVRKPDRTLHIQGNHALVLSSGSGQRVQAPVRRDADGSLKALQRRVRRIIKMVTQTQTTGPAMELRAAVILGNKPGPRPVQIQTLHVDAKPGTQHSFVGMVPMEANSTLLVALHSAGTVLSWAALARRLRERAAANEPGGSAMDGEHDEGDAADEGAESDVNGSDDETTGDPHQHTMADNGGQTPYGSIGGGNNTEDGSEGGVSSDSKSEDYGDLPDGSSSGGSDIGVEDEDAVRLVRLFSRHKVVRLYMQPGQLVLLHGNTVHAGDMGKPNSWTPRMHVYVQAGRVSNATYPIEGIHESFAMKFGKWAYDD